MTPRTLNDIFFAIAERRQERVMLIREGTRWTSISASEFYRNVTGMARALRRWGLNKGDRLAILSENRPEWTITDFASLLLGVVVVPIYSTLTAPQTAYILTDSGARVVVVSTQQQLDKVLSIKDQTLVERVVVMDPVNTSHAEPMQRLMQEGRCERDPDLGARASAVSEDDLASIVYTSGTTGTSKGVQLSHGNLTSNVLNSLNGFDIGQEEISISFLPLSHVTARHVDFALLHRGVTLAYCPFIEQLPQTLAGGGTYDLCRGAACLRKDPRPGGTED
jgi:long-chain acyl-CoA synthetase